MLFQVPTYLKVSLLVWLLFFFARCTPAPSTIIPSSEQQTVGILGGIEVNSGDHASSAVVGIFNPENYSKCTGTLIAEDMILTAAHCVDPTSKSLKIVFSTNFFRGLFPNDSVMRPMIRSVVHSKYDPDRQEGENTFDIALVYFEGGLPSDYSTALLSKEAFDFDNKNSTLLAFGFGVSNGFLQYGSGTLRKAFLTFRKHHSETEFQTDQAVTGVCSGDSGGPLFAMNPEGPLQIGIASRVKTKFLGCRDYAVYTRVDKYLDWIQENSEALRSNTL